MLRGPQPWVEGSFPGNNVKPNELALRFQPEVSALVCPLPAGQALAVKA